MIIDNANAESNRLKYIFILEFQPKNQPVFCLNLLCFQFSWLPDVVCSLKTLIFKREKVWRVMTPQSHQNQASFR